MKMVLRPRGGKPRGDDDDGRDSTRGQTAWSVT